MHPEDAREHSRNSNFQSLPPELRLQIHRESFTSTPFIRTKWMDTPITLRLHGTASDDELLTVGLPRWLMTCEIFFHEGRAVLLQIFSLAIGPCLNSVVTQKSQAYQMVSPLSNASLTIRTGPIHVNLYPIGAHFRFGTVGVATLKRVLDPEYDPLRERPLRCLRIQALFVNVCSVCQWLAQSTHRSVHGKAIWFVDLSCVGQFGLSLSVFEIEILDVDNRFAQDGLFHASSHWAEIEMAFESEVRRVGTKVTGDMNGILSKSLITSGELKAVRFRFSRQT